MKEIWRPIKKEKIYYEISNLGRVRDIESKKILKPIKSNFGYLCVYLNKERKLYGVHRVVCEAFIDGFNKTSLIHHINGNKIDNRLDNLKIYNNEKVI